MAAGATGGAAGWGAAVDWRAGLAVSDTAGITCPACDSAATRVVSAASGLAPVAAATGAAGSPAGITCPACSPIMLPSRSCRMTAPRTTVGLGSAPIWPSTAPPMFSRPIMPAMRFQATTVITSVESSR